MGLRSHGWDSLNGVEGDAILDVVMMAPKLGWNWVAGGEAVNSVESLDHGLESGRLPFVRQAVAGTTSARTPGVTIAPWGPRTSRVTYSHTTLTTGPDIPRAYPASPARGHGLTPSTHTCGFGDPRKHPPRGYCQ